MWKEVNNSHIYQFGYVQNSITFNFMNGIEVIFSTYRVTSNILYINPTYKVLGFYTFETHLFVCSMFVFSFYCLHESSTQEYVLLVTHPIAYCIQGYTRHWHAQAHKPDSKMLHMRPHWVMYMFLWLNWKKHVAAKTVKWFALVHQPDCYD